MGRNVYWEFVMSLPRVKFAAKTPELDFSMEMPIGFYHPDLPKDEPNFDDPTVSAPLMLTASPIAMALIAVAARPAYKEGSVSRWVGFLTSHFGISITEMHPGRVGGLLKWHPAILATGTQVQDGVELCMKFVFFEDGGHFFSAHAMCPKELEESYLGTLHHCIETIELEDPKGPTVMLMPEEFGGTVPTLEVIEHDPELPMPKDANEVYARMMEKKRDAAVAEAHPLLAKGDYDAAEQIVMRADQSIMGHVAIANMYTQALRDAVAAKKSKKLTEVLFARALRWKQGAYPDPHTEIEADDYEQGRVSDRAELVGVLGYDPAS